ncbi:ATP-binding protein [Pedobacter sp. PWIIR3]
MEQQKEPQPEVLKVFETIPAMYLILSPDLIILTASNLYLSLTLKVRNEIKGKNIFEVFPIDETDTNSYSLRDSLENVLQTKKSHRLPVAYFVHRYWDSTNTPVLDDDGEISYIIHATNDVTSEVLAERNLKISLEKQTSAASKSAQLSKRIEKLFADLPARIAVLSGPELTYEFINPLYHHHIGYRDLLGKPFIEALPEMASHPIYQELKKVYKTGVTYEGKEILINLFNKQEQSYTDYYFNIMYQARLDEHGNVNGILSFAYDITELVNARKSEHMKDEFLSIASHELKTPLTSIKAYNQLIKRSTDVEKLHVFAQKSAENITRLDRLISDLLDVTKINAGKMQYNMQEFSFSEMINDVIDNVQHTSSSHKINLESDVDILYTGDRIRIEQVLSNFLNNAIKYSPNGDRVNVTCKILLQNIIVSIQDFGIGINQHDMDHLFERYYRADNSNMQFEGLGLGLFISSEILKRHNGSFWIESTVGIGSKFFFRLPLPKLIVALPSRNNPEYYVDEYITIKFNELSNCIEADWTGFQNADSVRAGCLKILEMIRHFKTIKLISDNAHVPGSWSEATDWLREIWLPSLEKEGLRYFAWVHATNSFSILSVNKSTGPSKGELNVRLFQDYQDAIAWINDN